MSTTTTSRNTRRRNTSSLPSAPEAEAALLGSVMYDEGRSLPAISSIVTPGDFVDEVNAVIFTAMCYLRETHGHCEIVELVQHMRTTGQLEVIGGREYIIELAESVPSAMGAEHYAGIIRNTAQRRQIIDHAERLGRLAAERDDVDDLLDTASCQLARIADATPSRVESVTIGSVAHDVYDAIEKHNETPADQDGAPPGLTTGLPSLDFKLGGLRPGQVIVIAAAPGGGKSALVLALTMHFATRHAAPSAIFSLEMTPEQIVERAIAAGAGVELDVVTRKRRASAADFERMAVAVGLLNDLPIHVISRPDLSIAALQSSARWHVARHGVQAVAVDYLQLVRPGNEHNRNLQVAAISRALKVMALELRVPVIVMSQLNRDSTREARRPRLSDLRDSGAIEQDADAVVFIYDPASNEQSPTAGYMPTVKSV